MIKEKKKTKIVASKKIKKPRVEKTKIEEAHSISSELNKVSNQMSVEQIKRPRKILFMVCFYAVIVSAVLVLLVIKFTRKNNTMILETNNEIEAFEEYYDDYIEETTSKFLYTKETTTIEIETTIKETETTTKEIETTEKETTVEKTTEKINESTTEKKIDETETVKKETETTKKETEEKKETVKKETLAAVSLKKKNTASKNTITGLLPKYQEVLYSYPMFYQFSLNELNVISKTLSDKFKSISNQIFGDIDLDVKAKNGIIYYNFSNLNEYLKVYTDIIKQRYEVLPKTSYYSYIMQDKFAYDENTFTTNLKASFDFKGARNESDYYEVPTLFYEPDGGTKETTTRFLKKATVGFAENFLLTAKLQVLDDEWHTVKNPYFTIEECVGASPVAATKLQDSVFKIDEMLKHTKFNYIVFDKKGYITCAFLLT